MNQIAEDIMEMVVSDPYKNLEGYGYISCGLEDEAAKMACEGLLEMDPSGHPQWAKLTWKGWHVFTGLESPPPPQG